MASLHKLHHPRNQPVNHPLNGMAVAMAPAGHAAEPPLLSWPYMYPWPVHPEPPPRSGVFSPTAPLVSTQCLAMDEEAQAPVLCARSPAPQPSVGAGSQVGFAAMAANCAAHPGSLAELCVQTRAHKDGTGGAGAFWAAISEATRSRALATVDVISTAENVHGRQMRLACDRLLTQEPRYAKVVRAFWARFEGHCFGASQPGKARVWC